ncbi:MAG: beta-eliminating lyase-related protein [Pelagimonas sp.]|jgi:threonine aldolase|nr:beta-eliminating lyase-related protein [Pelagimonas sp.]
MFFASDNSGPVPPQVLAALSHANTGHVMAYGADPLTEQVTQAIRDLFEAPEAAVYLVPTGTAANSLALASLVQPFDTVFCSERAHIHEDECNAPEFYTGGAKLTLVRGGDMMTPTTLRSAIEAEGNRGVHGPRRGAVSITNVTEMGNTYSLDEIRTLCDLAHAYDLPVHLDGARFANACARLRCRPADMSWKAGVDVAVFGGTKNGLMGVEAVILFDPARAQEFELRRKRAGLLFSKHRYLAAQMQAYVADDLWETLAQQANASCDALRAGLEAHGLKVVTDTHANLLFFRAPMSLHAALQREGAQYHVMDAEDGAEGALARLVCDWSIGQKGVNAFLTALQQSKPV